MVSTQLQFLKATIMGAMDQSIRNELLNFQAGIEQGNSITEKQHAETATRP